MGSSTVIVSNIHFDRLYKRLSPEMKLLYFQLLSHPNKNKAGYYQIDLGIQSLLREKSEEECKAELMEQTGLWMYDDKQDLILIPTYLKYNKIGSPKTLLGMKYELEQLPMSDLCLEFIYRVNEYTEGKGLEYIPPRMLKYAKARIDKKLKNQENASIHEAVIYKLLTSY